MNIPFLTPLINAIGGWFTERQKITAAKDERKDELKKLELEGKLQKIADASAADLEADSMARKFAGYMDDISFYVFLAPLVLAFHPDMVPHITAGFAAIDGMPEWWKYGLALMLITVWGWKRVFAPIIQSVARIKFGIK